MIVPENLINKFIKKNIIQEEIHLPHGTKSAKVITHVDLDGVTSAISLVQQLQKQGIPKNRITIEFAQYGDHENRKRDFVKMFKNKNSSQWVGVTDFAKLPIGKPFDSYNKIFNFKGSPVTLVELMKQQDYSEVKEEEFRKIFSKHLSKYERYNKVTKNKFFWDNVDDLYDCCVAYSILDREKEKMSKYIEGYDNDFKEITPHNAREYKIKLVNPDFVSDHHSNEANDKGDKPLSKGQRGEIATGSDSEAEFFANKYAPGLWPTDDLKAISAVDSAKYTEEELKNTLFLQKNFMGANKKKILAGLISVLYDNLCKRDDKVCKWIILNSGPTLVSLYNTVKRGIKLNADRIRMLDAIKNGDVDSAQEIAETLPKILSKNWVSKSNEVYKNREGKEIRSGVPIDSYREKNKKDLENAVTGYASPKDKERLIKMKETNDPGYKDFKKELDSRKGKVSIYNNFAIFDGTVPKTQYGRFLSALYSEKGQRAPFIMRYWGGDNFFQISVNSLYKAAATKIGKKDVVDFSEVNRKVISDVCSFLKDKYKLDDFSIKRIKDEMEEKNGGHKGGIWTFNGFKLIKPTSKKIGSFWDDKDKVDRAARIEQKKTGEYTRDERKRLEQAGKIVPNAVSRYSDVKGGVMKEYDAIRHEAFRYAMARAIYWTNKLFPQIAGTEEGLRNTDPRFERK